MNKIIKSFYLAAILLCAASIRAQSIDDCLACHEDPELSTERGGRNISLFVDKRVFAKSIHGELECISCHDDLSGSEFPHKEDVANVNCGNCHDDIAKIYDGSLHGRAVARGEKLAPRCRDCHGSHDI